MTGDRRFNCFFRSCFFTLLLGFSPVGLSFEIIPIAKGAFVDSSTKQGTIIKKQKASIPRATSDDVICGKPHHLVRFQLNRSYAGLSFSVLSRKKTSIKVHWDNPEQVVFPYSDSRKTVIFPHSGGIANFYVRAYQPVAGNFYIMDDQGVKLKACPYSFLPLKRFRQSISVNTGETEFTYDGNISSNQSNSISINYRITPKVIIPEGGRWSFSAGVSKSEGSSDSQRINSSFSYSW